MLALKQILNLIDAAISEAEVHIATLSHDAHPDREHALRVTIRLLRGAQNTLDMQILEEE